MIFFFALLIVPFIAALFVVFDRVQAANNSLRLILAHKRNDPGFDTRYVKARARLSGKTLDTRALYMAQDVLSEALAELPKDQRSTANGFVFHGPKIRQWVHAKVLFGEFAQ